MGADSKIEWTHHTFNPWEGCTKVSPGCANCYAEARAERFKTAKWGPEGTRRVAVESYWRQALKWDLEAKEAGQRHRVFCASLADVFEQWGGELRVADGELAIQSYTGDVWDSYDDTVTPWSEFQDKQGFKPLHLDDVRRRLFQLIDETPNLDWLLLTKRPENIAKMMPSFHDNGPCPVSDPDCEGDDDQNHDACEPGVRPNLWLGTSVEDRKHGLPRIDILRQVPAKIRFLSIEPLLEDLGTIDLTGIHWVIVGGESGPHARPMHPEWVRSIRDQCQAAGVPFHFKQWGEFIPFDHATNEQIAHHTDVSPWIGGVCMPTYRVGKKVAGRILDGREWNEVPA